MVTEELFQELSKLTGKEWMCLSQAMSDILDRKHQRLWDEYLHDPRYLNFEDVSAGHIKQSFNALIDDSAQSSR